MQHTAAARPPARGRACTQPWLERASLACRAPLQAAQLVQRCLSAAGAEHGSKENLRLGNGANGEGVYKAHQAAHADLTPLISLAAHHGYEGARAVLCAALAHMLDGQALGALHSLLGGAGAPRLERLQPADALQVLAHVRDLARAVKVRVTSHIRLTAAIPTLSFVTTGPCTACTLRLRAHAAYIVEGRATLLERHMSA